MTDFNFRPPPPARQPTAGGFWQDVAKIALGIFFGHLLTAVFCILLALLGVLSLFRAAATPPATKPAAVELERVSELIARYKAITATGASEEQKAEAADRVADALVARGDRKGVAEWVEKARIHREAEAAGTPTRPVR